MAPLLRSKDDATERSITGKVFTIGSAHDCHLKLTGVPPRTAHILFSKGTYRCYDLRQDCKVLCNGSEIGADGVVLQQGDSLAIGNWNYQFVDSENATELHAPLVALKNNTSVLKDLIGIAVTLLRSRDESLFDALVASVSRLLRCDGARLVLDDGATGGRATIARFPQSVSLDRFSNRAIDWARDASHTVLMHEDDWRSADTDARSLEKNLVASIMCAPLARQRERGGGYLYLDRTDRADPFTEEDRTFCDALLPLFSEILANFHERQQQQATIARLQQQNIAPSGGMLFESECMVQLVSLAQRLAKTDSPVLVTGETGTGKELVARYIHDMSPRKTGPYRAINCGAIPEHLIESELFGHERGSFTGAIAKKTGLFESAHGGTVFLDEIGEMPLHLQVKLLRTLQEAEVVRVGGTETIPVDVRIVAATNRDLEREVTEGRFRQDLFFRLNVLTLHLPPLRNRGDDIVLLAEFFITRYCLQFGLPHKTLTAASRNMLVSYPWPGNIRELENVMQKAILFSETDKLTPETFSLGKVKAATLQLNDGGCTLKAARNEAERQVILATLAKTHGNVSLAGKILDIDRKWLIKKMVELGVDADSFRR